MKKLDISAKEVFQSLTPLDMKYVYQLTDHIPKEEKKRGSYQPFTPAVNRDLIPGESVTKQVLQGDKLLSFPFESIDSFVQLLKESARDKETISIKITIYRLAKQAKIVKYLCEAAENGKEVIVLMELRARFDEQNNINYSEILEEAGCKIMYGIEDYKVHSKVCLITKKNSRGIYYITQIGTGNYNESTSKIYTDLSLLTASKAIGQDATKFFRNISVFNLDGEYDHLLVAPASLKNNIIKYIQDESREFSALRNLYEDEFPDRPADHRCSGGGVLRRRSDFSAGAGNLLHSAGNSGKDRKYPGGKHCRKISGAFQDLQFRFRGGFGDFHLFCGYDDEEYQKKG